MLPALPRRVPREVLPRAAAAMRYAARARHAEICHTAAAMLASAPADDARARMPMLRMRQRLARMPESAMRCCHAATAVRHAATRERVRDGDAPLRASRACATPCRRRYARAIDATLCSSSFTPLMPPSDERSEMRRKEGVRVMPRRHRRRAAAPAPRFHALARSS